MAKKKIEAPTPPPKKEGIFGLGIRIPISITIVGISFLIFLIGMGIGLFVDLKLIDTVLGFFGGSFPLSLKLMVTGMVGMFGIAIPMDWELVL